MIYKNKLIRFLQNRVWRTYKGGRLLDEINNMPVCEDAHFPEDWIGSTTQAVNSGREHINEGISTALVDGEEVQFNELIDQDPAYFLGEDHIQYFGMNPMLLVKFLDSSVRLHFQAHPSIEFAQTHLDSQSGKAEAYYFIDTREETTEPYIYLGFQKPPAREELKALIENQDIDAIEQCFEKIRIDVGDCFYIPGGIPHAIGEGILMVEIMEPSDWAVRFEFEKSGYVLPEEARFMKRGLDFCLDVFDMKAYSKEDVLSDFKQQAKSQYFYDQQSYKETLIDQSVTSRFKVCKSVIKGTVDKVEPTFFIGIVVKGSCTIQCGEEVTQLNQFDKFFYPAGIDLMQIVSDTGVEILECYPPDLPN